MARFDGSKALPFFDGGPATVEDAMRLAGFLAGAGGLDEAASLVADLDRDARVSAADLLLLLRAAHGASTSIVAPLLERVVDAAVAPGAAFTVRGRELGTDATALIAVIEDGAEAHIAPALSVTEQQATFRLPAGVTAGGRSLRVVKAAVASPPVPLWVSTVQVLSAGYAVIDGQPRIEVLGHGFGTTPAGVSVLVDRLLKQPLVLEDQRVVVDDDGLTRPTVLEVHIGPARSNPVPFIPLEQRQGAIVLPSSMAVTLASFTVQTGSGDRAVPRPDGVFEVLTPRAPMNEFLFVDGTGQVRLGAIAGVDGAVRIDTASTAAWAVASFLGASPSTHESAAHWIDDVTGAVELAQLASLLAPALGAYPSVITAIESSAELRAAFGAAVRVAGQQLQVRSAE